MEYEEMLGQLRHRYLRIAAVSIGIVLVLVLISLLSFSMSKYPIGISESFGIVADYMKGMRYDRASDYDMWYRGYLVWEYNVPRTIAAVIIGAALAICGALMQILLRNPLADPYIIGISSGSLFGVTIFIILGLCVVPGLTGYTGLCANAFVFALIPMFAIVLASFYKRRMPPTTMVLVGIGTMYLFSSMAALIRFNADHNAAAEVYEWSLGSLGRVGWSGIPPLIAAIVVITLILPVIVRKLNAMTFNDNVARSLGINVKPFRTVCLVIVALVTAMIVSLVGTIGFVGLICPHIARMVTGSENRLLFPFSALVGATMLVSADCLSRVVGPIGFPVGVVTALIGCPVLIYMLVKQKKKAW